MTDELKALVEKVKTIIASGCGCDRHCETAPDILCGCREEALAAIRCVAEATREASDRVVDAAHSEAVEIGGCLRWSETARVLNVAHAASVLGEALRHE
jgi:hypothetical protein